MNMFRLYFLMFFGSTQLYALPKTRVALLNFVEQAKKDLKEVVEQQDQDGNVDDYLYDMYRNILFFKESDTDIDKLFSTKESKNDDKITSAKLFYLYFFMLNQSLRSVVAADGAKKKKMSIHHVRQFISKNKQSIKKLLAQIKKGKDEDFLKDFCKKNEIIIKDKPLDDKSRKSLFSKKLSDIIQCENEYYLYKLIDSKEVETIDPNQIKAATALLRCRLNTAGLPVQLYSSKFNTL